MKLLDLYRRDTLTLVVELREPHQVPAGNSLFIVFYLISRL